MKLNKLLPEHLHMKPVSYLGVIFLKLIVLNLTNRSHWEGGSIVKNSDTISYP